MINPLFHLTVLPPAIPAAEALSQDISILRQQFGGELCHLNPNETSPIYIPRLFFGFQKLNHLRKIEVHHKLHHFFNPDPFPFPVLKFLRRPVIYNITSGIDTRKPYLDYFSKLSAIVVPDERSLKQLRQWGLTNVHFVQPGINTSQFTHSSLPITDTVRLLCASAPWTKGQFKTKGFDAMLAAVARFPKLNLTLLWRGILVDELMQRVEKYNVGARVQIINEKADVNEILSTVHATIILANKPGIVKSYPHSLLDSLAAGKPVIVNRAIPMSDYVEKTKCGVVLEEMSANDIVVGIIKLVAQYSALQLNAKIVGKRDFLQTSMVRSYKSIYDLVIQ